MTWLQIGVELGMPASTANAIYRRAMVKLRKNFRRMDTLRQIARMSPCEEPERIGPTVTEGRKAPNGLDSQGGARRAGFEATRTRPAPNSKERLTRS
jgi:hypothetical protein